MMKRRMRQKMNSKVVLQYSQEQYGIYSSTFLTLGEPKSDPELIWRFDVDEVSVKSLEKGSDSKGK